MAVGLRQNCNGSGAGLQLAAAHLMIYARVGIVRTTPPATHGALRRLINDKVRRFAYGTAALDRARQAYSWKRVAAQVGSVYATVTGRGKPVEEEAVAQA